MKKPFDYAIYLLSRRDYSIYKMRQKLRTRECTPQEIDEVIERLLELNYLREDEYKRQRVKGLLYKGYANKYIIQKCQAEMLEVSEEFIDEIRLVDHIDSQEEIDRLIQKKLRNKDIPTDYESKQKLKNKVFNFLISKGYGFDEIKAKVNKVFYEN
jgi:regulatory protein